MGSTSTMSDEDQQHELGSQAIRLANSVILPMVLKSVLELDIIDTIFAAGDTFLSPSQIATTLPTKNPQAPNLLDRMLRLLASYSILKCSVRTNEKGEFERFYGAGPLCKFFVKNQDGVSVAPLLMLRHDKVIIDSLYHLKDAVLEGGVAFDRTYGMTEFEYLGSDERFNRVFNEAMANHTTLILSKIVDIYKGFDEVKVLVDVGGGIGGALSIICSKFTHIKAINFDLPHVVANAPPYPGVEHVEGNMFVSIPKGDAIFMKWIMCGWSDEDCLKILKNCWKALPYGGKVIILEQIIPETPDNNVTTNITYEHDMVTISVGGKGRTRKEYETLAKASGFTSCEPICCAYSVWVIEFHKTEKI